MQFSDLPCLGACAIICRTRVSSSVGQSARFTSVRSQVQVLSRPSGFGALGNQGALHEFMRGPLTKTNGRAPRHARPLMTLLSMSPLQGSRNDSAINTATIAAASTPIRLRSANT